MSQPRKKGPSMSSSESRTQRSGSDASITSSKDVPVLSSTSYQNLPYYFPNITDFDQVKKLMAKSDDGSYLLRKSFSSEDTLCVVVKTRSGQLINIKIDRRDGMYVIGDVQKNNVLSLIKNFETTPIENEEDVSDVFLKTPIINPCQPNRSSLLGSRSSCGSIDASGDTLMGGLNSPDGPYLIPSCQTNISYVNSSSGRQDKVTAHTSVSGDFSAPSRCEYVTCRSIGNVGTGDNGIKNAKILDLAEGWKAVFISGRPVEYISPPTHHVLKTPPKNVLDSMSEQQRQIIKSHGYSNLRQ